MSEEVGGVSGNESDSNLPDKKPERTASEVELRGSVRGVSHQKEDASTRGRHCWGVIVVLMRTAKDVYVRFRKSFGNPAIIAALITAVALIIAALISAWALIITDQRGPNRGGGLPELPKELKRLGEERPPKDAEPNAPTTGAQIKDEGGLEQSDEGASVDSRPDGPEVIRISAEGFSIGKYEVSNREYRRFCIEEKRKLPKSFDLADFNDPNQPVVEVNWYDANAYCKWLNRKTPSAGGCYCLPTKEEWDKAARYSVPISYPGGTTREPDKNRVNIGHDHPYPLRVDRSGAEETEDGIRDMTGNVAEWCADEARNGRERIIRGGHYESQFEAARYHSEFSLPPQETKPFVGFRIVLSNRESN